jgi:putative nucleotidyltransferase with HDIG domain
MNRQGAWELVTSYTTQPHLIRHMLAVEAAMRKYAEHFGGDPDIWGLVGLVHDFDYEQNPDISVEGHPLVGAKILGERGADEAVIRAVLSHASEVSGIYPESLMERTLVAVDELTGFLVAVALVRPSKSILDVKVKSVRKKWKTKEFAAAVNRKEIEEAAEKIDMPLDDHIQMVLEAMQEIAEELGLERQEVVSST